MTTTMPDITRGLPFWMMALIVLNISDGDLKMDAQSEFVAYKIYHHIHGGMDNSMSSWDILSSALQR